MITEGKTRGYIKERSKKVRPITSPPAPKRNQTSGYMYAIGRGCHSHSLSNFHVHHNAKCVKCAALEAEMVRVGAVIFCNTCVEIVFKTVNPVIDERETYLKWLHKSHQGDDENGKD